MTLEEARAVWLLKIGSDWFYQMDLFVIEDEDLRKAFLKLCETSSFDEDKNRSVIKIKCKS